MKFDELYKSLMVEEGLLGSLKGLWKKRGKKPTNVRSAMDKPLLDDDMKKTLKQIKADTKRLDAIDSTSDTILKSKFPPPKKGGYTNQSPRSKQTQPGTGVNESFGFLVRKGRKYLANLKKSNLKKDAQAAEIRGNEALKKRVYDPSDLDPYRVDDEKGWKAAKKAEPRTPKVNEGFGSYYRHNLQKHLKMKKLGSLNPELNEGIITSIRRWAQRHKASTGKITPIQKIQRTKNPPNPETPNPDKYGPAVKKEIHHKPGRLPIQKDPTK